MIVGEPRGCAPLICPVICRSLRCSDRAEGSVYPRTQSRRNSAASFPVQARIRSSGGKGSLARPSESSVTAEGRRAAEAIAAQLAMRGSARGSFSSRLVACRAVSVFRCISSSAAWASITRFRSWIASAIPMARSSSSNFLINPAASIQVPTSGLRQQLSQGSGFRNATL